MPADPVWTASFEIDVGEWRVGVRTDSAHVAERVIAEHGQRTRPHRDGDPALPPGYAVVMRPAGHVTGKPERLGALRIGHTDELRSRSEIRLTQALLNVLDGHRTSSQHSLRIRAGALIRDDVAVLLPFPLLWTAGLEARLRQSDTLIFDTNLTVVDSAGWLLSVPSWDPDTDRIVVTDACVTNWLLPLDWTSARASEEKIQRVLAGQQHLEITAPLDLQRTFERFVSMSALITLSDPNYVSAASLAELIDSAFGQDE